MRLPDDEQQRKLFETYTHLMIQTIRRLERLGAICHTRSAILDEIKMIRYPLGRHMYISMPLPIWVAYGTKIRSLMYHFNKYEYKLYNKDEYGNELHY